MSRIDARFAELAARGRTGLIPFFTAGDPSPEAVVPVMHALVQSYKGWQTREPKRLESEEIRIAGANLQWEAFGPAHHTSVLARMRLVATYAIKADDHKWGRSAVTRLENEIRWVSYALRD